MVPRIHVFLNQLTKGHIAAPRAPVPSPPLHVVLVHAHPLRDSFSRCLADATHEGLQAGGHTVERIDLYGTHGTFQPALTPDERAHYFGLPGGAGYPVPSPDVQPHVDALKRADALVFVYPTWWFNVPAVLKGFIDRTFLPGVAFRMSSATDDPESHEAGSTGLIPGLANIKKLACVSTYGCTQRITFLAGDNGRNMFTRGVLPCFSPMCTVLWLGLYDMDNLDDASRRHFVDAVRSRFTRF
uniref:Flavodoxin-like fold domain-containing protein n=1 Tax=Eutreptiella gymnastica TaxID=73025 RepID=A0A7S1NHK2_9EUGL|mmetsp:Transcript_36270/g.64901  ORF Transcript_36270/g.64901 Transcript_36270/m.64901 type:complete len:242 (+) Transcript_36270:26-751(+)